MNLLKSSSVTRRALHLSLPSYRTSPPVSNATFHPVGWYSFPAVQSRTSSDKVVALWLPRSRCIRSWLSTA